MLKILRKYNIVILAFGGIVLMIAFVLPQLPQMFGGGAFSQTVAVIDGENLAGAEYNRYEREFRAAAIVGGPVLSALGLAEDPSLNLDATDHWIMLRTLAERNGLVGGTRDGEAALDDFASQLSFGIESLRASRRAELDAAVLRAQRSGLTLDEIYGALAALRGVARLVTTQTLYTSLSEPEAVRTYQSQAEQVTADLIWAPSSDSGVDLQSFSDEALEAFFDEHKDVYPRDSEIGIGYLRPESARGEFLTISRSRAVRMVPVDELVLSRYWTRNKERFGDEYAAARDAVEAAYRNEEASRLMDAAIAAVLSRRELELREYPILDRYRDLPADFVDGVEPLSTYEEAARSVFDASVSEAAWEGLVRVTEDAGDFVTEVELARAAGIGGASYQVNDRLRIPFAKVDDLDPSTPEDSIFKGMLELGQSEDFAVQVGVLFGPMRDAAGNVYFVRFIDARPESPPDSYRDIEGRVRRDLARVSSYESLIAQEQQIMNAVGSGGLSATLRFVLPGVQPLNRVMVTPEAVTLAEGGTFGPINRDSFREAVTAHVQGWDPTVDAVEYALADRVLFVPVPESLGVAVVEIVDRAAPSVPEFRQRIGQVRRASQEAAFEALGSESPLSPARLASELDYVKVERN